MRRAACRGWLAVLAVVCASWPAAAFGQQQADPDLSAWAGRTTTAARIELEGQPIDDPGLTDLIEIEVGAPLEVDAVRETLAHLRSLGRFDPVTVRAMPDGEGVIIVFALVPVHPIDRIEFRGLLGLDRRSLERAVLEQAGGRLAGIEVPDAQAAVERLLADEGFFRPTVTTSVESTHDVHRSTLVFNVNAGPRQRVGRITVTNESPLPDDEILSVTRIAEGAPYRRRAIEDALRDLSERLRASRYYEASASHFPVGDGEVVDVTVTVEAGPIVDIVTSGDPLPDGGVDEWIPIRRENSADDDLLEDSRFRIESALKRDGYWRAEVEIQRVEQPDAGRVLVTVDVRRGRKYRLRAVSISGQSHFTEDEVRDILDLHLGAEFRQDEVNARQVALAVAYDEAGYAAEIEMVAEEAPVERADADGEVILHISIVEGPARVVGEVEVNGASAIAEAEIRRIIQARPGSPFRDITVRRDRTAIEALYRNAGFLRAAVTAERTPGPTVDLTFTIVEGEQTIVDHVIVVGNSRVSTRTIMNQVVLRPGQPYGQAQRADSQRRLTELAMFRRISITSSPGATNDNRVDVIVQVEEAPATTIGYGGGLEVGRRLRTVDTGVEDRLEFAPRGFFEIGRRNLFGGNRSINLFSRLSLRPDNVPGDPTRDGRGLGFSEYRVTTQYREAHAWRSNTDLVVSATAERAIRTSFTFRRRAINAEALRRLTTRTSIFGRYALDSTRLFDTRISPEDQPLIDRLFPQIRLSSLSGGIVWDNRDDVLDPTAGGWISFDLELASQKLGSQVGFVKTFVQATGFRRVTRANRVVLAGRIQVGVAKGFARQVTTVDANGHPVVDENGQVVTETVADLPAGRRFFAGGSTSVRGFQQDRLGVPAVLNVDGLSKGGNGLVVLNGEVRTLLVPTVSLVAFVDGGNVFERASDIRPTDFRGSVGFGVRYRSPLGPLRLDFGFKLDRRLVSGKRERGWEFHLSIGEAF